MTDFIEDAARWLSEDDTAYADMEDAMRAAQAMLGPALAENEALRRQNRELVTEIAIRDGVISDLQNRPVAPEGYAVVPLDPTPAMLDAVADVPAMAASIWKDMLDAAAQPRFDQPSD